MSPAHAQSVIVVGRDPSGDAAVQLLRQRGTAVLQVGAEAGVEEVPAEVWSGLESVVVSAGVAGSCPVVAEARERGISVIGERELAFRHGLCLHVAVTGGNGKSTTAGLIAHILRGTGRRVEVAGTMGKPACAWVEATRELDFLVHAVAPAELDYLDSFRPVVGVLLNAAWEPAGVAETPHGHVGRLARLFRNQQAFDWAIVQSGVMAHLTTSGVEVPGKLITFSAASRQADLRAERGLLVSQLEGWSGPLWDMGRGRMRGQHFAEDALAALAVGRVLRLTLEQMIPALETFVPGPGRMEQLGEAHDVRFVDDGRAANPEALGWALTTLAPSPDGPNIWLLAGGDGGGRQFYDLGPVLSPRVRHAFVFGEAARSMRSAWSLFAPCSEAASLVDATKRALALSEPGDWVLYSPACPSRDPFNPRASGSEIFREVVMSHLEQAAAAGTASEPASSTAP